jgi:uncharacterized protein
MELTNDFTVEVPVEEAWEVLTDIERIAPCLPGAELREVEGDDYLGVVKVKVGPITTEYKGKVTFLERDDAGRRAVLKAQGRESRGQGHASATITAALEASGTSTRVSVVTDLTITGKVAQLGRGVLADVSNKLMSEFAESLEASLVPSNAPGTAVTAGLPGDGPPGDGPPGDGPPGDGPAGDSQSVGGPVSAGSDSHGGSQKHEVREVTRPAATPVDLTKVAGRPVLKRALPALVLLTVIGAWLLLRRRRRASHLMSPAHD